MRRLLATLPAFLVALMLSMPAWATDNLAGTITSSGASTTNLTTATPFTLYVGSVITIQCDADVYLAEGPASSPPTVTSANGFRLPQWSAWPVILRDMQNPAATTFAVGIIPVSGSANCKVFVFFP